MAEKRFSKGEAIRFGWKTVNDNLGFFIGLVLVWLLISYIPAFIVEALKQSAPLLSGLINIASSLINIFIGIGILKIGLRFVDGEKASFEDLFAYAHLLLKYLGASILVFLAVLGGFICLIVPGIILAVRLQFFGFLILDRNAGVMESLKKSFAMTKGPGMTGELFLLGLLLGLINLAGFLCLLVGLFATIPTTWIANAYVYRRLITQYETQPPPAPAAF